MVKNYEVNNLKIENKFLCRFLLNFFKMKSKLSILVPNSCDVFNFNLDQSLDSISLVYQGENTEQNNLKIAAMLLSFSNTP